MLAASCFVQMGLNYFLKHLSTKKWKCLLRKRLFTLWKHSYTGTKTHDTKQFFFWQNKNTESDQSYGMPLKAGGMFKERRDKRIIR